MLNDNTGLLTFDDDSPLFTKKKRKKKRKAKKKVPTKVENVTAPVEDAKSKKPKKKIKKVVVNKNIPKYTIKCPKDCKHLLPAFKKKMNEVWARLNGDNIVAADVSNYIRGVANVAKKLRPKEYEELRILMQYAKGL